MVTVAFGGACLLALDVHLTTKDWLIVPGRVIEVSVRKGHALQGDSGNRDVYWPQWKYTYTVNGAEYRGHRERIDARLYGTEQEARDASQRLRVGDTVDVYFDPDDPRQSVLERGVSSLFRIIVASSGLAALGAWVYWVIVFIRT
jgi:hypothetical protein